MTGAQFQLHLIILWLTVSVVAILGVVGILIWAVRTRQFSNQDRARYLALESHIPEEDEEEARKNVNSHDP